jgi:hypothetical protein
MTFSALTLNQLRNTTYAESTPERVQQKAQEDQAVGNFAAALNKFNNADANAQNRQMELEVAKVKQNTGVSLQYEASFWGKGALVFPKDMPESAVKATLAKITTTGEAPPLDGNQEEGYSIAVSDFSAAAPELVNDAKTQQQKEVIDLQAALTEAANKTLQAHGWDLSGYNHRWQTPSAESPPQIAVDSAHAVTTAETYPTDASYALGEPPSTPIKTEAIAIKQTLATQNVPEKNQPLSHSTQLKTEMAKNVAEIRELLEKTKQAALESAHASQDVIQSLASLNTANVVADRTDPKNSQLS